MAVGKILLEKMEQSPVPPAQISLQISLVRRTETQLDVRQFPSRITEADYRLPSEAEWEYAARGGTTTARFWGETPTEACSAANVHDGTSKLENGFAWPQHDCDDGYAKTAPAGSFRPNDFGIYDILGNVWEMLEDCWHGNYDGAATDGDAWTTGDCSKVVNRGGSWSSASDQVRSSERSWSASVGRSAILGLRVARTLP